MRWIDIKNSIKDFWNEFRKVKSGIVGIVFLGIFLFILFFERFIVPFPQVKGHHLLAGSAFQCRPRVDEPLHLQKTRGIGIHRRIYPN
jgi:hypothetical protein